MAVVAVRQYQKPEDEIDILLRRVGAGLQIAQGIYGIKTAMERSDMNKLQMQREQEKARAEELKNKLSETGLLTQQQVIQSDIIPFRTSEDLAKAVGAKNWEEAQKKYPTLSANTFELNIATPKKTILDDTGEIIGVDEDSRLLKKGQQIIRPQDLKDFDINTFKASIKRSVLDKIMQGKTGGVRTLEEFQEKWLPVDDPEILRNLPSEIAALREPVQVMVDGDVVTRMGVRRSSVRPITPTTPIQEMRLRQAELGLQKGLLGIEQAKTGIEAGRLKLEDMRNKAAIDEKIRREQELSSQRKKQGVFTFDEFLDKYIPIESKEDILNKYPDLAKGLPDNAFNEVTIFDEVTGNRSTAFGVDKRVFDTALKLSKKQKTGGIKKPTQQSFIAATFAERLQDSNQIFDELEEKGFDPSSFDVSAKATVLNALGGVGEYFKTEDLKRYEQAKRNFVNATLRRESGAAISVSEFESADKQYFPLPGDTPKVREQKRQNRLKIQQGLEREAEFGFEQKYPKLQKKESKGKESKNKEYVKVSNGKETLTIPRSDLKAAQKDGYNLVK